MGLLLGLELLGLELLGLELLGLELELGLLRVSIMVRVGVRVRVRVRVVLVLWLELELVLGLGLMSELQSRLGFLGFRIVLGLVLGLLENVGVCDTRWEGLSASRIPHGHLTC